MTRIRLLLEKIPFFVILLPLFLLIHIELEYRDLIDYNFVTSDILELLLAPVIIFLLTLAIFRNYRKAAIFSFCFLLIYYYFCDLKDFLQFNIPDSFISSYTLLLPVFLTLLIFLFIKIKRSKKQYPKIFLYLNSLLLLLIALDAGNIAFRIQENIADFGDKQKKLSSTYTPCTNCEKPDIFYFIFDGYASSSLLKNEFLFDNPLDSFLLKKGFRIVHNSKSNYNLTPFSMGSVFNLNYLPGLRSDQEFFIKQYLPGVSTVYHTELFPILKKEGYRIFNHSIFDLKENPPSVKPFDLWEINQIYDRHNIFWKANHDIGWLIRIKLGIPPPVMLKQEYVDAKDKHLMETINNTMGTIRKPEDSPKFVYSHLMLPHGPYTFDSAGKRYPPITTPMDMEDYRKGYLGQVNYSNSLIRGFIDSIFQNTHRPFVIILQGDHGFRFLTPDKRHLQFDNLNAFYFSNSNYTFVRDSMTNINTFRILLNNYFGKKYPMLRDTSIFLHY